MNSLAATIRANVRLDSAGCCQLRFDDVAQALGWQPIDTAPTEGLLILYAPPENLYEHPEGRDGEYRIARKHDYCWATLWMPLLPAPRPATVSKFTADHVRKFYSLYTSERREVAEWLSVARERPDENDTLYAKRILATAKDSGKLDELAGRIDAYHARRPR